MFKKVLIGLSIIFILTAVLFYFVTNNLILTILYLVISLGSFGVNREKPESATIKTVIDIVKHTKWSIGIFPQGTTIPGAKTFEEVKGGFVSIAKLAKMDIVPIAICNFRGYNIIPFKVHVTLKIGKPISYKLSEEEILTQWKTYMETNVV